MLLNDLEKMMSTEGLDRKLFRELFDLYYEDLTVFVYSFVNDREVARDIVNDLFLSVWENRTRIDVDLGVKSYLFRMGRNYAFNYLKHLKVIARNEQGVVEEYKGTERDEEEWEHRMKRIRERMQELPEKQKTVVLKCCVEGKLYKEAAIEMNISENTVKTHLMRAMKFLREGLQEDFILFLLFKELKKERFL